MPAFVKGVFPKSEKKKMGPLVCSLPSEQGKNTERKEEGILYVEEREGSKGGQEKSRKNV